MTHPNPPQNVSTSRLSAPPSKMNLTSRVNFIKDTPPNLRKIRMRFPLEDGMELPVWQVDSTLKQREQSQNVPHADGTITIDVSPTAVR